MKHGEIKCTCGQVFYFETNKDVIACTSCGLCHETINFPVKEEIIIESIDESEVM